MEQRNRKKIPIDTNKCYNLSFMVLTDQTQNEPSVFTLGLPYRLPISVNC